MRGERRSRAPPPPAARCAPPLRLPPPALGAATRAAGRAPWRWRCTCATLTPACTARPPPASTPSLPATAPSRRLTSTALRCSWSSRPSPTPHHSCEGPGARSLAQEDRPRTQGTLVPSEQHPFPLRPHWYHRPCLAALGRDTWTQGAGGGRGTLAAGTGVVVCCVALCCVAREQDVLCPGQLSLYCGCWVESLFMGCLCMTST
mmetsp:Transcript_23762/g.60619  ORF Transcript_23762/g.60619 Transcript_23762/m.60619 type:complete len:204 (+) Transcript_23762:654-1265(+)